MDNLTHSVVGLAVGELVHRSLRDEEDPQQQGTRRRLLLLACWAASNFPDLDLILTPLLPSPLGYLLHHRGHTHTLLYALPQALLLWLLIRACSPSARLLLKQSAAARIGFLLTLAIGFVLHIGMDFLNSYGVHPFHPFDSRWFYGDMVYIVEPVFWIAFGVPVVMAMPGRALKASVMASLIGALVFFTARGFLSWASLAMLVGMAAVTCSWQQRSGPRGKGALTLAIALGVVFIGVQGFSSSRARENVAAALHRADPDNRLIDAAMTAFPANPFCWAFVSVETKESAGSYTLHRGIVSAAPGIVPVSACPPALTALGANASAQTGIAVSWEERGDLERLRRFKTEDCHFEAWLRFARVPSVSSTTAFDARFATSVRGNFTTLDFARFHDRECARFVPPWDFPRADLLSAPPK